MDELDGRHIDLLQEAIEMCVGMGKEVTLENVTTAVVLLKRLYALRKNENAQTII